jgi:hypothetical protein
LIAITRRVELTRGEMLCVSRVCLASRHGGTDLGRRLEALALLVRSGLSRERLPDPPPEPPAAAPRTSWAALLLRPDPLPEAPPSPARSGPGLLATLLAPETLPRDPELPRPARRRLLAVLLAPERLDPPGGSGPEVH